MKKYDVSTILLVLILLAGLALLLYPSVSNSVNLLNQSGKVSGYVRQVAQLENDQYEELLLQARVYNQRLNEKENRYLITEEEKAEYEALLDVAGTGVMGYIEIPSIGCSLPIYHGTDESVLQTAIGHLPWSSLPTGGKGTHTVVSGHRGLPSARLFTDLDRLTEGDRFFLRILDEVLTYEVDQISVVEPYEVELLEADPKQDYCTLVTCTPYGVNTHRLLVRGHRVENEENTKAVRITSDAVELEWMFKVPAEAASAAVILFFGIKLCRFMKSRGRNLR